MLRALFRAFKSPLSWGLLCIVAGISFLAATWASNVMLVWDFLSDSGVSIEAKAKLAFYLSSSIGTNFHPIAAAYTILISLLFGLNVALLVFYVRVRRTGGTSFHVGAGVGGFLSGVLGMGCAACGSALLLPLLSIVGAGSLVSLLPLNGQEFGIISVALLILSCSLILKQIANPAVCPIE